MSAPRPPRRRSAIAWSAAALLLYYGIGYPRFALPCLFKSLTGYDCPACGGQRALHALLCGHGREAFGLNPYLAIMGPCVLTVWLLMSGSAKARDRIGRRLGRPATIACLAGIMLFWWIFRNTDCYRAITLTAP